MTTDQPLEGRDGSPNRPISESGRDGSPNRPTSESGRDGSPNRPNRRLGEASLPQTAPPKAALPQRKWLGHAVPSWVDHGVFFITINCDKRGGSPLLAESIIACIRDAAMHYHGSHWFVHLWLVMPDHVHALLSFPRNEGMVKAIGDWKRYTSRITGVKWQKGFFDHRLRHDESFEEKAHYIRMNPVREKLVEIPEAWPHVWSFDGRDGSPNRPPSGNADGRDAPPGRPQSDRGESVGTAVPAVCQHAGDGRQVGTAVPAVCHDGDGRLGEASLPFAEVRS
jgi:putative transposase